ncbi:MAG: HAMP domain-containing protein, partial [Gammaproteobacteria bacterium]|nr:HAMP domain-containing protein [Gammaproteobacteria bacterium]
MLRSKRSIIVFVIAQVLLITLVIGLGFFMLSQHEKSDWQEFRSQHQHTTLLRIEKNVNQSDAPKTWLNNIILNDAVLSISLWGEKGQVLAYLGSAKYVQTHDNSELEENVDVISSSIKISQRQIHVKTIYHNQSFMEKKYVTKFSLMGILLLGMMSSVVSFFVFSLWNSHNKRAVKKLATKVARGDFESRLLIENNDEFQQVAEIINTMLDSVELTQKR